MKNFLDLGVSSINKFGEELCGDKVESIKNETETILVLSDGLGSGVKANILATLTTKIAITMLQGGEDIYEVVETIMNTLPVCKVRELAYSTLGIIKVDQNNFVEIFEYDTPPIFFLRKNKIQRLNKEEKTICGKSIKISRFQLQEDDVIVLISDGVIHAGIGETLNLGWKWEAVAEYLETLCIKENSAIEISKQLTYVCNKLYMNRPGDDTTVATIKLRKVEAVDLFTGPPEDPSKDQAFVESFLRFENNSKKIVSGGTAAKIISRELNRPIDVDVDTMTSLVPPIAYIEGIDLVTEGVITLSRVIDLLKECLDKGEVSLDQLEGKDGASRLCRILVGHCTHLYVWVGKAINPAHQNPNLPRDLSVKLQVVEELMKIMKSLGKEVKKIEL